MKNLSRALRYFRSDAPRIGMVGLLLLAGIGMNLLKPWPLAVIVDSVLGHKPLPNWLGDWIGHPSKGRLIALLSVATLFIHLGHGLVSSAQNYLAISVGLLGLRRFRDLRFFSRTKHHPILVQTLPNQPASFFLALAHHFSHNEV